MSRKMKVLVSVLVAVLLLMVGGTAIAMAQEEEEPAPQEEELSPQAEANGLLARIAEILGVPEEDLIDAFTQARQEMMQERWEGAFNQALDEAVAEGLLTPEEAEEIREWWEQKPEALGQGLLRCAAGFMAPNAGSLPGVRSDQRPEIKHRLELKFHKRAMERACVTPEEIDEIQEWWNGNPEALDQMPPRAFKAVRGRHMIAVSRGWNGPIPYQMAE